MSSEKRNNPPKRGPMGGARVPEKAKDFKGALKRLFKELKSYKILIVISLILAALGSILTIMAPNKLSELTDEISSGLVLNKNNFEQVTKEITSSLNEENMSGVINEVIVPTFSEDNLKRFFLDKDVSKEDKDVVKKVLNGKQEEVIPSLASLDKRLLEKLFFESTVNEQVISVQDKIMLINAINNNGLLPESLFNLIFSEIEIKGIKLSSTDQGLFINALASMDKDTNDVKVLYSVVDSLPEEIQKLVKPKMDIDAVKKIFTFLVVLYGCSAIFIYIQGVSMTTVANKFANKLRRSISLKINKLPLKYFDNHAIGDTLSRVTNDVDTIAQSMNNSLASLVHSITMFLGCTIMMFYTNWILALTAIFASLIGFAGMSVILKSSQKYFIMRQTELGNLNGHIEEIYSGLNVVKVYNGKESADKVFDDYNKRVCDANRKSQFLSGIMQPIMGFIGNLGYVSVCVVGAMLTMNDIISFGVIVAFMTYVRLFTNPLSQIAQALTSLQSTAAASERVFEFIDEEEMNDESSFTKVLDKEHVKGDIEFDNVVFQYDNTDAPTIKNFTAYATSGMKIAIVGPTGAGKTTMVNLLMKFYDITGGDIKIDGVSTKELTRENIHSLFTMVLQDTWLFNGTIRENIVYNRENVSEEILDEVMREVGLDHFVKTLPEGYDTVLSDNDSVSSGQRQLLTIARGMVEDAPFLILDEATSNVDTRTEELVQSAMDKLMHGRTSFIIAHRLSTIKNADLILVMKDGNIIETGNHDELMNKKGFYADLYNSQFEL